MSEEEKKEFNICLPGVVDANFMQIASSGSVVRNPPTYTVTTYPPVAVPQMDAFDKMIKKGNLDVVIEKVISRKLFIWFVATALLLFKIITPELWVAVSAMYIGSNMLLSAVGMIKGVPTTTDSSTTTTNVGVTNGNGEA